MIIQATTFIIALLSRRYKQVFFVVRLRETSWSYHHTDADTISFCRGLRVKEEDSNRDWYCHSHLRSHEPCVWEQLIRDNDPQIDSKIFLRLRNICFAWHSIATAWRAAKIERMLSNPAQLKVSTPAPFSSPPDVSNCCRQGVCSHGSCYSNVFTEKVYSCVIRVFVEKKLYVSFAANTRQVVEWRNLLLK